MKVDLSTRLGPIDLTTPLIAASGTVGSVVDFLGVTDFSLYGAAVAKSVSGEPWAGRPPPRLAPAGTGMLNSIGIQNPGVEAWSVEVGANISKVPTQVWGSAVGTGAAEFARVARRLEQAGVAAIEVNLSCPNLEDGRMFALDAERSAEVVSAVRHSVSLPVGAKLSPNAEDVALIAGAVASSGADWVTVANTVWGARIDLETRRPAVSGVIAGYSGPPIKPIALRCVIEVRRAHPDLPIVGCGGVITGDDVVEFVLAGASAVGIGTVHFAEPRAAKRILKEIRARVSAMGVASLSDLVGGAIA